MVGEGKLADERIFSRVVLNDGKALMALWGGRFSQESADALSRLSRSVHFDWRLAPYDLVSSMAHLDGLERSKLIDGVLAAEIRMALKNLLEVVSTGKFLPLDQDEDVHSALERGLIHMVGEKGGALRAGRSRNDQVVTDTKLYLLDVFNDISLLLVDLSRTLLDQANQHLDTVAPGFTHLQHAQPVTFGQELAKHAFAIERDLSRIADWRTRTAKSPLGSGALAGSSLVLDPERAASSLGFDDVAENSIDAVSDRDFVAEALFILALIGTHLSRIGEEFTLYSSSEFGWVKIADAYSTGSSIMPQKRNPDVAELSRGKSGRLLGNLVTVMTVLKGLPFAYNRDLQEDKEPLFDSIDTLLTLLPALIGMIGTANFQSAIISRGAVADFALATEVADYLVRKGVPFSSAHETTGAVVRSAEELNLQLHELPLEVMKRIDGRIESDIFDVLNASAAVDSRTSRMGTAKASVAGANARLMQRLNDQQNLVLQWKTDLGRVLNP